jgi:hypothetical protein
VPVPTFENVACGANDALTFLLPPSGGSTNEPAAMSFGVSTWKLPSSAPMSGDVTSRSWRSMSRVTQLIAPPMYDPAWATGVGRSVRMCGFVAPMNCGSAGELWASLAATVRQSVSAGLSAPA